MATIDDILNALRGQGYANGSTWMQQPQTQADGPPMPTPPTGAPMPLAGAMPRHHAPRRPDTMPTMDPAQFERERAMAAFNMQPQMGQTAILPPHMQAANLGQIVPDSIAPAAPSGMIGLRARAPEVAPQVASIPGIGAFGPRYLADLSPNNQIVASNGFAPFGGRY